MRQRTRFFLVVLLLMFAGNIFSQINSNSNSHAYRKNVRTFTICDSLLTPNLCSPKFKNIIAAPSEPYMGSCWTYPLIYNPALNLFAPIAKNFSIVQLGIVCKKEFEFEKRTSIPLRLRIGSLDYTNYMERKPNALKPL